MAENKGSRAGEVYAAGLLLAYAAILFAHAGGPSLTDYANWTYQGVLLRDHLLGRPDAAHLLKHYPVPNSAATLGIGLLALAMPWMTAAKVWLCVQLGVVFFTLRHLLRTVGGSAAAWVIVPQSVFLNVNLWYGFVNFELGICWVLLMASLLLRRVRGGAGVDWPLGALLLVAFFTHMIPFALCGLLLLLYAAQTKHWRALWQLVPSTLASAWYVLGRFLLAGNADGQAGMVESVRNYSLAFWEFKVNSYAKSFGFVNPMGVDVSIFGRAGLWVLLAINGVLAVLAAWAIGRTARTGLRGQERFLWLGLIALVPVFLLAPGTALGVSDPGARILQVGLGLALTLCWQSLARWGQRIGTACAAALALAGILLFLMYGGDLGHPLILGPEINTGAARFAHVPNEDQNYFYPALERGDRSLKVFPTGMFLNQR